MNKKGFTLVELLITIAIIGILAGIAIPTYVGMTRKSARSEASTNLQNLRMLLEQYYADRGCYYQEGTPLVCTNKADIEYKATHGTADSGLEDYLPGFKPGALASLNYTYKVTTTGATAIAFSATATAKANSRVDGDAVCSIDQNNTRVGPCW